MKIYQVIQYGGEYEDKYELVENTFISKEKAELELERLSKELEEAEEIQVRCSSCKIKYYRTENFEKILECGYRTSCFCDMSELKISKDEEYELTTYQIICDNDGSWCEYVNGYKIEEFEVED